MYNFPGENSSRESINRNTNSNITSNFTCTLPTVNYRTHPISTLTSHTPTPPPTPASSTMANTVFLSAREKRDSSEMALSDYSLSFSLSRYSKVEGTRKAFQILMHAAPDMQILPASDTDTSWKPSNVPVTSLEMGKTGKNIFSTQKPQTGGKTVNKPNKSRPMRL